MKKFLTDIKEYYISLISGVMKMKWYERSIVLLFILRILRFPGDGVSIPQFIETNPEYTYHVLYYYICTSLIELNIAYILHKKYSSYFTQFLVFLGVGKVIDNLSYASIKWSLNEGMWVLISVAYIFYVWKQKK